MALFYFLQQNVCIKLHVVQLLQQFLLHLDEAGEAGSFHILNLDITDENAAIAIT